MTFPPADHQTRVAAPLAGLTVLEISRNVSQLGTGMALGTTSLLLSDQGARRVRASSGSVALDQGIEYERGWGQIETSVDLSSCSSEQIAELLRAADIALVAGPIALIEGCGLDAEFAARVNPRLIWCRFEPSPECGQHEDDFELLVQARSGMLGQIPGNRPAPVFGDFPMGAYGAALVAVFGVTAALVAREKSGKGSAVSTSLHDGLLALLTMRLARADHPTEAMQLAWTKNLIDRLLFECADGNLIQIVLGARGARERFTSVLGEVGAELGIEEDRRAGEGFEQQFQPVLAAKDRDFWLDLLRRREIPAQAVLGPGEVLLADHPRAVGLARHRQDPLYGSIVTIGRAVTLTVPEASSSPRANAPLSRKPRPDGEGPLAGVRVLDLGHWFAGPYAAALLTSLGADVIKVEPVAGEPMRPLQHIFVIAQRGKRSVAIDIKSEAGRMVLPRLLADSDIVMHNFRPGVAERLGVGYDAAISANPGVVYCHAPAFGSVGPWAESGGFDQIMQSLCGMAVAGGGEGMPPVHLPWSPIDVAGAWLGAFGALLGHFAANRTHTGVFVESTLLAAGLYAKAGVFVAGRTPHAGPRLDAGQTGYGPGYRIVRARDDRWLAIAIPDAAAWCRLRNISGLSELPERYTPLRITDPLYALTAEVELERLMATGNAQAWSALLTEAGIPHAAVIVEPRAEFQERVLANESNRAAGRVISITESRYGVVDQIGVPARLSWSRNDTLRGSPELGEHTAEILHELGFDRARTQEWAKAGMVGFGPVLDNPSN